jgi:RimJ/RimL family protein N-acetyltransferase
VATVVERSETAQERRSEAPERRSEAPERSTDAPLPYPNGDDVFAVGKRIYMRALRASDLPLLSAWAADPLLEEMVGSELFQQFTEVYRRSPAFLEALRADRTQLNLVICTREGDRPMGLVRLFNIHRREGYAFLETIVADTRALRLGYGIEASKLIAYWAVDVLKLRRLEAKVYPWNRLSINTMKRRGWQLEGRLRQAVVRDGQYHDLLVFGILDFEITANKADDDWSPIYHTVPDVA